MSLRLLFFNNLLYDWAFVIKKKLWVTMSAIAKKVLESTYLKPLVEDKERIAKLAQFAAYGTLMVTISACAFLILFPIASFVAPSLTEPSTLLGRIAIFFLTSNLFSLTILFTNIFSLSLHLYSHEKQDPVNPEIVKLQTEIAQLKLQLEETKNIKKTEPKRTPIRRQETTPVPRADYRYSQPAIRASKESQSLPSSPQKRGVAALKAQLQEAYQIDQETFEVTEKPDVRENLFSEKGIFSHFKEKGSLDETEWAFLYKNFNVRMNDLQIKHDQVVTILKELSQSVGRSYVIENLQEKKEEVFALITDPRQREAISLYDPVASLQTYIVKATGYDLTNPESGPSKRLFIQLLQKYCGISGIATEHKEAFILTICPSFDLETMRCFVEIFLEPYLSKKESLAATDTLLEPLLKRYCKLLASASKEDKIPFLNAVAFQISRSLNIPWLQDIVSALFSSNTLDKEDIGVCLLQCYKLMELPQQRTLYNQLVVAYDTGIFSQLNVPEEQTLPLALQEKL